MGAGLTPGIMSHSPLEALSGAGLGIALESTPVKSGLASGLYYGGKALGSEFPSLHNLVPSLRLPDMPSGVMDESGGWGPFGRGKKNDGPLGVPNDTSFDTPWADKERTNKPGFSTSRGGSYVAPPTNIEGVPSIPDTPLFNAEEAHKSDLRDIVAPSGGKSRTYGEINPIVSRLLDKHGIDNPDPGSYIPDEPRVKPQLPSEDQETSIENNHSFQDTVAKYLAKYKDVPPPLQDLFNETERHRNTRGLAARYLAHPDEIPPGVKKIVTDPEKE
jgi:hypothetical protein